MAVGTLLIVEDNPSVASAVQAYMSRVEGWPVVITAADAHNGLDLAVEHGPTAIVLDNQMPGGNGIDVLAELRRTCPQARIVVHSSEISIDVSDRAVRLGADAVVPKGQPLQELAAQLRPRASSENTLA